LLSNDANWWRQAVIYQIYPRSFKDSNSDGLGDIKGITSKADYLKSLNIDAVWLSPFYPSALADGGYDVDDYRNVDPRLGSLADFAEMVEELHARNIRIFVDIVPNHSSNRHVYFQEALASPKGSNARARYHFYDGRGENGELPPNDWPSHFAPSGWTRITEPDGTPGQWYFHFFAPEQPDWNWEHPDVAEEFRKTLRFWADRGVDGFRIDVAHALKKDMSQPWRKFKFDAFNEPLSGDGVLLDRNEVHEVYKDWRKIFNEYNPPRVAVAEAYVRAERRVLYARPDELGQAFNFDLLGTPFNAKKFKATIKTNLKLAKTEGSSSTWVLSNHDLIRHATRYGLPKKIDLKKWLLSDGKLEKENRIKGVRRGLAATTLLMAVPGAIYLYNGEELGLPEVADLPANVLQDPIWERNLHTDKGRDGCRVPLPWTNAGTSFGFGQNGAHLPQPAWFGAYSVENQERDPKSVLSIYRRALELRKELQCAEELEWVKTKSEKVIHFRRPNGWVCITNFTDKGYKLPKGEVLFTSAPLTKSKKGQTLIPPATTVWMKS
jgi:alpha-glucosidase